MSNLEPSFAERFPEKNRAVPSRAAAENNLISLVMDLIFFLIIIRYMVTDSSDSQLKYLLQIQRKNFSFEPMRRLHQQVE